MAAFNDKITHQWRDAANLILGIWLALSPAALSYVEQTVPAANATLVGIVIAVAAAAALISFHMWEEWVNVALAAWLIVSPFVLDYAIHSGAVWNQIVVGMLVGCLALWTTMASPEGGVTA
jgi:hypothetical protein